MANSLRNAPLGNPSSDVILDSPEWYPLSLSIVDKTIQFVRMSRTEYDEAAFLDPRAIVREPANVRIVSHERVERWYGAQPPNAAKVVLVFHTAFCCSTLFTRYCKRMPNVMVLNEPFVLTQIADGRGPAADRSNSRCVVTDETLMLLRLLTRTYHGDDTVVIKLHDSCDSIGLHLLSLSGTIEAVVLYSDLPTFVLWALKSPSRRAWLRRSAVKVAPHAVKYEVLRGIDPSSLSDCCTAAYVWLKHMYTLMEIAGTYGPGRVHPYTDIEISETPCIVFEHLEGMGIFDRQKVEALGGAEGIRDRHAKWPSIAYDSQARRREADVLARRFSAELTHAREFASRLARCAPERLMLDMRTYRAD